MPNHIVKVGDRFRLGAWEWEVRKIYDKEPSDPPESEAWFKSVLVKDDFIREIDLWVKDADSLNWILPTPTISEEACEELVYFMAEHQDYADIKSKLRSMVEKK